MSNRQARREQMRANRQQRAAQRPSAGRPKGTPSGGPRRRRGGGPFAGLLDQPFVLISVALALALAGVLAFILIQDDGDGGGDDDFVTKLNEAHASFPADLADGSFLGAEDAPLTLTMYEDFQCPFCLQYNANVEPDIIDEFVRGGRVRLEFKHFPILGRVESVRTARAAVCAAEQDKFWELKHRLFLAQAEAGQFEDEQIDVGRFSDENLREHAIASGVDGGAFDTCFASNESLETVQAQLQEAQQFGFPGTPGFALNGVPIRGADSIEGWREVFETALDSLTPTAEPTGSASPSGSPAGTVTPSVTPTTGN
jgi:protein-disulfide isomerase